MSESVNPSEVGSDLQRFEQVVTCEPVRQKFEHMLAEPARSINTSRALVQAPALRIKTSGDSASKLASAIRSIQTIQSSVSAFSEWAADRLRQIEAIREAVILSTRQINNFKPPHGLLDLIRAFQAINEYKLRLPAIPRVLLIASEYTRIVSLWANTERPIWCVDLQRLDPYSFEELVGHVMRLLGRKNVEVTRRSGDGGVDIYYDIDDHFEHAIGCVQVKRLANTVSRPDLQRLVGAREDDRNGRRVKLGAFITTSRFSKPARVYALTHSIRLIDGEQFIELMSQAGIKKIGEMPYVPSPKTEFSSTIAIATNAGAYQLELSLPDLSKS